MTSSFSKITVGLFVYDGADDGCKVAASDGVAVGGTRVNDGTIDGIVEELVIVGTRVDGADVAGNNVEGGSVVINVGADVPWSLGAGVPESLGADDPGPPGADVSGPLGAGVPGTEVGLGLSPKSMETSVW